MAPIDFHVRVVALLGQEFGRRNMRFEQEQLMAYWHYCLLGDRAPVPSWSPDDVARWMVTLLVHRHELPGRMANNGVAAAHGASVIRSPG